MEKVFYILYVFFMFYLPGVYMYYSLKKGDVCFDGVSICASLSNCPSVLLEIQKGIYPVLCSIQNSEIIICCPESHKGKKQKPTTKTCDEDEDSVKFIDKGKVSISTKKCNEYFADTCSYSSITQNSESRPIIVGGEESRPKQFPHMALVGYGKSRANIRWSCGGSLISEKYVLSAAHCAFSDLGEARWVRLGELDLESNTDDADPQDYLIVSRIVHPEYKAPSVYNDIALFKLSRNVQFNDYIRPLCLHENSNIPHKNLIAAGWGALGYGEITSSVMMNVNLSLIDFNVCNKLYGQDEFLPDGIDCNRQFCAGYLEGEKDTCQGDSGGPLHYINVQNQCSLMYTQVGIVSFGKSCASKNSPGVYTKVSYYIPWIESIVWQ